MKFDMKKPCKDCPFVKGSSTNMNLDEERIPEIVDGIRSDKSFTCHKTLPYYDSSKKVAEQHCAGAMIFLERENRPNQAMRIAERLNMYNRFELDMDADLISNKDY